MLFFLLGASFIALGSLAADPFTFENTGSLAFARAAQTTTLLPKAESSSQEELMISASM